MPIIVTVTKLQCAMPSVRVCPFSTLHT